MSLLTHVNRLFGGRPAPETTLPAALPTALETALVNNPETGWEPTAGAVHRPHQERRVTFRDNQVSGRCVGRMAELTGSALLCAFEDLPAWLPSLTVRLTVGAAEGTFAVSLRQPGGAVVAVTAPGTLESEVQLVGGRLHLRCEAAGRVAKGLRYEVVIV